MVLDNAKEGVCWSSPTDGGADDGPARKSWPTEKQSPFAATMEIIGLKVGS